MATEFLIPIAFFAMVLAIVYLFIRRKERAMLIEKGMSPDTFETTKRTPSSLKWGMLLIGLGLGVFIGRILTMYTCLGETESFFSMIFIFGGASLLLYHLVVKKTELKDLPKD